MNAIRRILGPAGQYGFITLTLIVLFLSFYPTIYESFQAQRIQKGRELVLEHGYTPDFNLYLSKIQQGKEGRWTVVELYTHEAHQGGLLQIFYLILGKIGAVFRLPPVAVYHLSRVFFGVVLLLLIYLLSLRLFPKSLWAFAAFIFVLTTSSWPAISLKDIFAGKLGYGSFMPWWTIIDPLRRITITPHLLAGQGLLIAIVYLFFYEGRLGKWGRLGLMSVIGVILGLIFPPALLISYPIIWGTILINKARQMRSTVALACFYTFLSLPTLVYLSYMTSFYPWKRLNDYNILYPTHFPIQEFFLACGPLLIVAIVGAVVALKRRDSSLVPMIVWIASVFGLMGAIRSIPSQNALRFTQVAYFVPIGILAAYGLMAIGEMRGRLGRIGEKMLFLLLVGLGAGHMVQSLYWQLAFIEARVVAVAPEVPRFPQVMYPLTDFMDTLRWMEKNTPADAVFLADETFANYIPAYTGRRVYYGHANTPQGENRLKNIWGFYWGLSEEHAKRILKEWGVNYIVFGPQEKETASSAKITDLGKIYPFLQVIYQNQHVTVYRVK